MRAINIGLLFRFLRLEVLVQVAGFFSGLLLVNYLSKAEYAIYTISTTLIASLAIIADGGLASGFLARAGYKVRNSQSWAPVLSAALRLRSNIFKIVLLPVAIIAFLYLDTVADRHVVVICTLLVLVSFYFQSGISLLSQIYRIEDMAVALQRISLGVNSLRIILISSVCFYFKSAIVAVAINMFSLLMQFAWAAKGVGNKALLDNGCLQESAEERGALISYLKRQMPSSVYYVISAQFSVLFLAMFSGADSVAEVGALGRFSIVFSILGSLMQGLVFPRFAMAKDNILHSYLKCLAFYLLPCLTIFLLFYFFSDQLLLLLGNGYDHLGVEFFLSLILAVVSGFAGAQWGLNSSRGWVPLPYVHIGIAFSSLILFSLVFPLDSVQGVLLINICAHSVSVLFLLGYAILKILRV